MKNLEIVKNVNNLIQIVNENREFGRKVSYAITKNLIELQKLSVPYEEERKKIVEKYQKVNSDGEPEINEAGDIFIQEDKVIDYQNELNELLNIDVEFNPHKVSMEDFPENIEPRIMYILDFMIE